MQPSASGAALRLVSLGVVVGTVAGAAVGVRALLGEATGLWVFGLLFGACAGALAGGAAAALSAALVVPRAVVARAAWPASGPSLPLWWHLLVPVPVAAGAAWWVLQAPSVGLGARSLVTAALAAATTALLVVTSRWVLAPLTGATTPTGAGPGASGGAAPSP